MRGFAGHVDSSAYQRRDGKCERYDHRAGEERDLQYRHEIDALDRILAHAARAGVGAKRP